MNREDARRSRIRKKPKSPKRRVHALVRERKRAGDRSQGYRYDYTERWVDGRWDGEWLWIDGETTPTGRTKRKAARSVIRVVEARRDLIGLHGNAGVEVQPFSRTTVRDNYGGLRSGG